MKIILIGSLALLSLGFYTNIAHAAQKQWASAEEIISKINLPNIPNRVFELGDFNPEKSNALPAINAAILSASNSGGGRIVIPKGKWFLKGPIHLKSKIELRLSKGCHLLFSGDPADYLPAIKTRWEGTELFSYSPLIYAANVSDVAITGDGVIDGNEDSLFKSWQPLQRKDMQTLRKMGAQGIDLQKRLFVEGTYLRPSFIQFFHAERVLLEGYKIVNAPFWVNHLVYTNSATVRNLKVDSHFPNNDGLDIESSQYVLVENNWFRTGDDSVVVKSGRDLDGRTIGIPSKNIVVRNNDMGGEDGIALGSEMSGGISNVHFVDNVLRTGHSAIRFKANLDRGGLVEHIRVKNFKVESFDRLFWFQLQYPGELGGNFPSTYRDIVFENFSVKKAGVFLEAHAPSAAPLQDVTFKNITVEKVATPLILENAIGLKFENVKLENQTVNGELDWTEQ